MDIAHLQAFVVVAENQSFSAASAQLYLTQPAISKRIAALESELGVTLFDRIGRQVTLTEAGGALLRRAHRILDDVEDTRRALANLSGNIAGRLSIGTSHHIGLHRLPPVLRSYTADYPRVQLDLHFMDSEAACKEVLRGHLELAIVTLPLDRPEELHYQRIWRDPLAVVVGTSHPLAQHKRVNANRLAALPAILPSTGTFTRQLVEKAFAPLEMSLQVSMSTNYLETIRMLVNIGLGWSVLPKSMTSTEVQALRVDGIHMQRELGVVWHARRTLSNAATTMRELLQNVAS